ncbi:hypothetical protein ACWGH5_14935 [Streptomyces sp. NPDC054864]
MPSSSPPSTPPTTTGHVYGPRRQLSTELGVSAECTENDLRAGQFLRMVNYHNDPAS